MPISHSAATELEQLLGSGTAGELLTEGPHQSVAPVSHRRSRRS